MLFLSSILILGFLSVTITKPTLAKKPPKSVLPTPTPSLTPTVSPLPSPTPVPGGRLNFIKGIEYNPLSSLGYETDYAKIGRDIQAISELGATDIGLYNCGKFDWYSTINSTMGESFCAKVYPLAVSYNLKMTVGYFSNPSQDWSLQTTRDRASTQYQDLVTKTKDLGNVSFYLIGNEVFEHLAPESQKIDYAKWIEEMVVWTKNISPDTPVVYADNSNLIAMPYLITYVPNLAVYGVNDYEWNSQQSLEVRIKRITDLWPNIKVLLHEWGSDSFDVRTYSENREAQAVQIAYLATEVQKAGQNMPNVFLGSYLFSFNDDWTKVGSPTLPDPDKGQDWVCLTCFDFKANEDYWGITGKPAYDYLQTVWR